MGCLCHSDSIIQTAWGAQEAHRVGLARICTLTSKLILLLILP